MLGLPWMPPPRLSLIHLAPFQYVCATVPSVARHASSSRLPFHVAAEASLASPWPMVAGPCHAEPLIHVFCNSASPARVSTSSRFAPQLAIVGATSGAPPITMPVSLHAASKPTGGAVMTG